MPSEVAAIGSRVAVRITRSWKELENCAVVIEELCCRALQYACDDVLADLWQVLMVRIENLGIDVHSPCGRFP